MTASVNYGSIAWASTAKTKLNKLYTQQKQAVTLHKKMKFSIKEFSVNVTLMENFIILCSVKTVFNEKHSYIFKRYIY